jgi:hypothetical protein
MALGSLCPSTISPPWHFDLITAFSAIRAPLAAIALFPHNPSLTSPRPYVWPFSFASPSALLLIGFTSAFDFPITITMPVECSQSATTDQSYTTTLSVMVWDSEIMPAPLHLNEQLLPSV